MAIFFDTERKCIVGYARTGKQFIALRHECLNAGIAYEVYDLPHFPLVY
jgi:hypothetical protein